MVLDVMMPGPDGLTLCRNLWQRAGYAVPVILLTALGEADLPRVFDVAYRGSNGRVPRADAALPSGSGLGLAIAAGLVQAHHGTLSARSLDIGARFEVRLPLAVDC